MFFIKSNYWQPCDSDDMVESSLGAIDMDALMCNWNQCIDDLNNPKGTEKPEAVHTGELDKRDSQFNTLLNRNIAGNSFRTNWISYLSEQKPQNARGTNGASFENKQPQCCNEASPVPNLPAIRPQIVSMSQAVNTVVNDIGVASKPAGVLTNLMGMLGNQEKDTPYTLLHKLMERFCIRVRQKDIFIYNGTYYAKCDQQAVSRLIMGVFRNEVAQSGSPSILKGVYDLLLATPEIAVLDSATTDPNLVPFQDGILRLSDREFLHHSPEFFTTYTLNAYYTQTDGDCPEFDKYLYTATGGDRILATRIWEILGYCLTPDIFAKACVVFQGVPGSGKSMLCDLIKSFFPPGRISNMDVHDLKRNFAMAELEGKSIWISPDLPAEMLDTIAVGHIKKLTGRDTVNTDVKYAGRKQYSFEGKLIMVTNYPLLTKNYDEAFVERIVAVPFLYAVPPEARDYHLLDKLLAERSAIARRAMDAYFRLRANHYRFSGEYAINSSDLFGYGELDDGIDPTVHVYTFLRQFFEPSKNGLVEVDAVYQIFCEMYGNIVQKNTFSKIFVRFASELYGAEKIRSRLGEYTNARSCVRGLKLKE